ncbi:kinetochore complex Sim4 subunit Fta1-domain-containing protein [Biscogniauxia marginata]|nr:kinetochore complex Sim4 subunit Fta1-domain-containing protein [Biscogniauxia marginata]
MPPRRRGRASPAPEAEAPADRASSTSASDHEDGNERDSNSDDESPPPGLRFYNTTFSTYRVSPLYTGTSAVVGKQQHQSPSILSSPQALQTLSKRLRDTLVGDVVRGVQVGLGPDSDVTLGRTGALAKVEWRWVGVDSLLGYGAASDRMRRAKEREGSQDLGSNRTGDDDDGKLSAKGGSGDMRKQRALCLSLQYENANFSAFLLPDLSEGSEKSQGSEGPGPSWTWQTGKPIDEPIDERRSSFIHLPLLLLRMPAPLKSIIVDFLSSTFDCRINPLRLGTRTLVRSWETWLSRARDNTILKDAAITLGFHIEPLEEAGLRIPQGSSAADSSAEAQIPEKGNEDGEKAEAIQLGLKAVDIIVPAGEVRRFARVGEETHRQRDNYHHTNTNNNSRKRRAEGADPALGDEKKKRQRPRKPAGGRDEEGWEWRGPSHPGLDLPSHDTKGKEREKETFDQPFTEALAVYLEHHLALDMFHPGVRVLRVACDGFVLSESRVKIFPPRTLDPDAGGAAVAWTFTRNLVQTAMGRGWSREAMKLVKLGEGRN